MGHVQNHCRKVQKWFWINRKKNRRKYVLTSAKNVAMNANHILYKLYKSRGCHLMVWKCQANN